MGMAVASYVLTCDHCTELADEDIDSDEAAAMFGWWFVRGPENILGGTGERTYCSLDCMQSDL